MNADAQEWLANVTNDLRSTAMNVNRRIVADKIEAYLRHQIPLTTLVDWAEQQVMEADFDSPATRDAVARLGLADVRAFGLTWDDCEQILRLLGFDANVSIVTAG
jgi:hypothetical protein